MLVLVLSKSYDFEGTNTSLLMKAVVAACIFCVCRSMYYADIVEDPIDADVG